MSFIFFGSPLPPRWYPCKVYHLPPLAITRSYCWAMTFINRLSLEFFLPVQTFNFRNPYLALRWHSLRQVYPYSFLFNLPTYQGPLLTTMSFPFHFSSFSGLCPDSFISRFESFFLSFRFFFFFFFSEGVGDRREFGKFHHRIFLRLHRWAGTYLGTGCSGESLCWAWEWTEPPDVVEEVSGQKPLGLWWDLPGSLSLSGITGA